jgi:hypothetical protein
MKYPDWCHTDRERRAFDAGRATRNYHFERDDSGPLPKERIVFSTPSSAVERLTQADEDAIASGHGRPATLAEALSILKGVHKLSPAEQRDIDEAINCIVAFDGITDEMVDTALEAAQGVIIDTRRHWHPSDKATVRAMLDAVIDGMKPMRSRSVQSATQQRAEAFIAAFNEWYDRDGSVGGLANVVEDHAAVLGREQRGGAGSDAPG